MIIPHKVCALCASKSLTDGAHVQAKREGGFPSWGHLFGNILRLCPNCHRLFDKPNNFITIHPTWRVFIFSRKKKRRSSDDYSIFNPYYQLDYSYAHDDSLQQILREYIVTNCTTEYRDRWGSFERDMQYLENDLKRDGLWDQNNGKPVEKYIWYVLKDGSQRP